MAGVSGLLQVVIFPVAGPLPPARATLAWVALVPLLLGLIGWETRSGALQGGAKRVGDAALAGYACGVLWYLGTCYWVYATMHDYGGLSTPMALLVMLLFCLYLGLYHALFGFVMGWLALRTRWGRTGALLASPVVWVAVELARARVTSFPWNLLGVSAIDSSVLTTLAPWTGAYGISFVLAAGNALFAARWVLRDRKWQQRLFWAGAALVVVCGIAGRVQWRPVEPGREAATLLQPNLLVGQMRERISEEGLLAISGQLSAAPQRSTSLVASPEAMRSGLVLWPESPSPYATVQPEFLNFLAAFSRKQGAVVIAGASGIEQDAGRNPPYREYNSAALFTPDQGYAGRYDKIHLVPFGEFVPYADLFAFASGLTREVGTVDRGRSRKPLIAAGHRYGVFLCYESIFGDEVRQFVRGGANVLVNLSDDGWYGDTSAPFQHINMARMRAIENRRWLLRDTNSGITSAVDPYGRVVEWTARHVRSAVQVHFSYRSEMTFYTLHGDLFAYACALVTSLLLAFGSLPKRVN